ncbi:sensor histidine kinase [Streptomyces sp. JJ36]|uniref:sensor histidine kinase n=1 Tax=Streptomyces sp. JJ36 TaxID=2736645 RepID=UPI001F365E24|nr:sensor histidine kinase [Streptomyces sp. JJ36]MCF6524375.1 sensor histidine kinase [Streptomyces sp. JJ36]
MTPAPPRRAPGGDPDPPLRPGRPRLARLPRRAAERLPLPVPAGLAAQLRAVLSGPPPGPPGSRPPAPRWPWPSTAVLAVVVLAGSHFAAQGQPERVGMDTLSRALLLLAVAFLLVRRRWPAVAALGTAAAVTAYVVAGYAYGPVYLCVVVATFSAVPAGRRGAAWAGLLLLWSGQALAGLWLYRWLPPGGDTFSWGAAVAPTAWLLALAAAAELVRVRREQWARRREEEAAAERRRVDEERLRIARELHDVLAHSISVINVQAGMGLALLDSDPEQARTALTTIKSASKEALGEVRQVLGTLRTPGEAPRAPAPGLGRLPELAAQAARAGLRVETRTEGDPVPLPPGAELAAFRIVQEALTNVVRHSAARRAEVLLRYAADRLEIRVDDEGPGKAADAPGGGNGLTGMRERAAGLGGTVEAGPRPGGGFRVRALLPLGGAGTVTGTPQREAP